jgi:hypothetical protein
MSTNISAQSAYDNQVIFSYAPAGFVSKIRVKFEIPLNTTISTGTFFNLHYLFFKGPEAEPFVRFYHSDEYPEGFYSQIKLSAGFFSSRMDYTHTFTDSTISTIERNSSFPGFGAGFAFGYQFLTRRSKHFDFFLGFKYMPFLGKEYMYSDGLLYKTEYDFYWYLFGPGSRFNGHFGIGYSF